MGTPDRFAEESRGSGRDGGEVLVCAPLPWQQLVDALGRVGGDPVENVTQPCLGVDAVELGGLGQGVDGGGAVTTVIGASKQPVLAAKGQFPFILPMSGRFAASIIAGIPISGWMLRSIAFCGGMMGRM